MGFAKSFAKNAVFYLNVVYGLVGLVVEGIGFALLVKWITTTSDHDSIGISWLFYIMAGVLMSVTALFGCYGAVREKKGVLIAYAIFMLTVFVLQVALAVWVALYFCIIEGVLDNIFEHIIRGGNSTSIHKAEPKVCDTSPLEALTSLIAYSLCSAFRDGSCVSKQDGMYESWYAPTILATIGVPLIEVIVGCFALYLAIYLATTERRSYSMSPATKDDTVPMIKQTSVC